MDMVIVVLGLGLASFVTLVIALAALWVSARRRPAAAEVEEVAPEPVSATAALAREQAEFAAEREVADAERREHERLAAQELAYAHEAAQARNAAGAKEIARVRALAVLVEERERQERVARIAELEQKVTQTRRESTEAEAELQGLRREQAQS